MKNPISKYLSDVLKIFKIFTCGHVNHRAFQGQLNQIFAREAAAIYLRPRSDLDNYNITTFYFGALIESGCVNLRGNSG